MKKTFFALLLSVMSVNTFAQAYVKANDNDFEWKMIGRVLLDGGVFVSDSLDLGNAVELSDVRLGVMARFLQNWRGKIEVGFAESKVGIKEVYIGYEQGFHTAKVGHFFEPFAIEPQWSNSDYRMVTMGATARAFGDRRKLGASYMYNCKQFTAVGGIFSDGDVDNVKGVDEGYSVAGKVVGRPIYTDYSLLHLGVSSRFSIHDEDERKGVTFTSGMPTDLLTKQQNSFLKAEVANVINQWKVGAELIMLYNKWYFQSEFMLAHVNRFGAKNYTGEGWYAQASYLVRGDKHRYSQANGWVSNPAPKSIEVVARYNITDMNDRSAGIMGGQEQDVTVGVNYVFNQYVLAKLNYTHSFFDKYCANGKEDVDMIQMRLQFWF